jgi:hypothetical protein
MAAINQEELLGQLIPNVYIRRITLESGGSVNVDSNPHIDHERETLSLKETEKDSLVVNIDLVIKETLDNDEIGTWFSNQDLLKYLKIKVIQSTDPRMTGVFLTGKDVIELAIPRRAVPPTDLRMKLMAEVLNVNSVQRVHDRMSKAITVREMLVKSAFDGSPSALSQFEETVDDDGNRVFNITLRQRFEVKTSNPKHLAYFAVTSIDISQLAQDHQLQYQDLGLKSMNGKVAADVVIDEHEVIGKSFIFYDPKGKIWAGPTHRLPNGKHRSGSEETTDSMALNRVSVANTKIQDFRNVKEIKKILINLGSLDNAFLDESVTKITKSAFADPNKKVTYFSDMCLTRDKNGDAKFFFSIDMAKVIEQNTLFGGLFKEASPRLKMMLLRNTQIRQMRILRKRVRPRVGMNRLGSPTNFAPFDTNEPADLVASSSEISWKKFTPARNRRGSLKEVELATDSSFPMIRHFTGMDFTMSELTDGLYQYAVELEMDDATVELVQTKVQDLLSARNQLQVYMNDACLPSMEEYTNKTRDPHISKPSSPWNMKGLPGGSFSTKANRFTQDFTKRTRAKYRKVGLRKAPWVSAIATYAEVLDLFTDALKPASKRQKILNSLRSFTSPKTGTPGGIELVMDLIDSLIGNLTNIVGVTIDIRPSKRVESTGTVFESSIASFGRTQKSTFKLEKDFMEVFDSNVVKGSGIDYLSIGDDDTKNDDGLRSFSSKSFKSRVDLETLRFYKTLEPSIDMRVGGEVLTQDDTIRNTNYSFLSPTRIDFPKMSYKLIDEEVTKASGFTTSRSLKSGLSRYSKSLSGAKIPPVDVAREISVLMLADSVISSPTTMLVGRSVDTNLGKEGTSPGCEDDDPVKANDENIKNSTNKILNTFGSISISPATTNIIDDGRSSLLSFKRTAFAGVKPVDQSNVSLSTEPLKGLLSEAEEKDNEVQATANLANSLLTSLVQSGDGSTSNYTNPRFVQRKNPLTKNYTRPISVLSGFNVQTLTSTSTQWSGKAVKTIQGLNQVVTDNDLKALPNQLKAVFLQGSTQNVVRLNKLSSIGITNAVEKERHVPFNRITFEMLAHIEYLSGWDKNKLGETMLKKPVWKTLTSDRNNNLIGKAVLCRMTQYENQALGLKRNKGVEPEMYDQYFILEPQFITAPEPIVQEPDSPIAIKVADAIKANIPGIKLTAAVDRGTKFGAHSSRDAEEEVQGTVLPVGIRIVELYASGDTATSDLDVEEEESPALIINAANFQFTVIEAEIMSGECQTDNVEEEFMGTISVVDQVYTAVVQGDITGNLTSIELGEEDCVNYVTRLAGKISALDEIFALPPELTQQQAFDILQAIPDGETRPGVILRDYVLPMLEQFGLSEPAAEEPAPLADASTIADTAAASVPNALAGATPRTRTFGF